MKLFKNILLKHKELQIIIAIFVSLAFSFTSNMTLAFGKSIVAEFKQYIDKDLGIMINYPYNWKVEHACCKLDYGWVHFFSPIAWNQSKVIISYVSPPSNLDNKTGLQQKVQEYINNFMNNSELQFNLIKSESQNYLNRSIWAIEYTYNPLEHKPPTNPIAAEEGQAFQQQDSPTFHVKETWVLNSGKIYILTYSTKEQDKELFVNNLPTFNQMVNSFRILS